ncbi:hypothetical protein MKX01_008254 [Papaver californicum]|nr:hypothetical protein MKX01_008254 [Papaver californicum]
MEVVVSTVLDIFSRLWTCSAHNTHYVRKLKRNLNTLEISFNTLRCQRDDVNTRVEMEESNLTEPAKRTNAEVQNILDDNEAIKNDDECYFWCSGRKSCRSACKLGKLVSRKQIVVEHLLREGDFRDVTYRCQPDPLQQIPVVKVMGMDAKFNEVMESLVPGENLVQVVGLYGMGGVGKTTLLQKVNNEFAERKKIDLVIWILVSKYLNIRTNDIFQGLKNKRFLLLLDDIWEGIDLITIGVLRNAIQLTGSKVVFTTRSEQCLEEDQAWTLSCHPDVLEVAKKVARECRGLPLALITIGRTMSSKGSLQQWQHALYTLQESASQFSAMIIWKTKKYKSCYLYCSLHPDDYSISIDGLIGCWLGEGFLENVDDLVNAVNEGHDFIRCLKDACLLEIWGKNA